MTVNESMKVFGHYWEVVHAKTGQVVNSGFEKGDGLIPGQMPDKNVKGFDYRVIPLYAPEEGKHGYAETEAYIDDSYGRSERDFVQGIKDMIPSMTKFDELILYLKCIAKDRFDEHVIATMQDDKELNRRVCFNDLDFITDWFTGNSMIDSGETSFYMEYSMSYISIGRESISFLKNNHETEQQIKNF